MKGYVDVLESFLPDVSSNDNHSCWGSQDEQNKAVMPLYERLRDAGVQRVRIGVSGKRLECNEFALEYLVRGWCATSSHRSVW